jgi:hypothetical protein
MAKKRQAPQKECPECHTMNHAAKGTCQKCGFAFPKKKTDESTPRATRAKPAPLLIPSDENLIALVQSFGSVEKANETLLPLKDYHVADVLAGLEKVKRFLNLIQDLGKRK